MYSNTDIENAVAAGALSPKEAQRFKDYIASSQSTSAVDEEQFRLLTGFNDIFVSIAAAILLFAVGWIGNTIPPHIDEFGPSPFAGLFVAVTAWILAEFFTRKRRMALPSIVLLLAFIGGVFAASAFTMAVMIGKDVLENNEQATSLVMAASAAIAAGLAWLHWKRFYVPITIATGAAAVVGVVIGLVSSVMYINEYIDTIILSVALVLGIGVFLFAMWWDASDLRRETRRSDVAFWLHLLSAPLIVHPIFSLLGLNDGSVTVSEALIVIVLYIALGIAAIAIDRRALLVSALAYVLWALTDLFEQFGAVELSFAFTALIIGSALLLLSAFWHSARGRVVGMLPATLQSKLPVLNKAAS